MSRSPSPVPAPASPAPRSPSQHEDSEPTLQVTLQDSPETHTPDTEDAAPSSSPAPTSTTTPADVPESASSSSSTTPSPQNWQAVWSPAHNMYYFYNSVTHETTWTNPLQPSAEAGPSTVTVAQDTAETAGASSSAVAAGGFDIYAAAAAQGIDPALAHLDPSLASAGSAPGAGTYTAKFNSRTGAFTRPDGRDPTHLSEYERAKRMSEFYFDVNAWEQEVEQRKLEEAQEEESKKRKRPSKKDLDRFKEQKKQKKLAKTAWLRT
ncbi:uncharacterized protein BXZ73DRAFT_42220 [Epithele typhae]|uniref:uncharacterized protein n=1 Tax=Epithele typhae TaxID=378194 RepID=UPI002007E769|nr:uncharacterized protein BXZ73DRAFT_42220 [Epithele typhae]KAH9941084.1 hypothetical protein BXZ73DRAFT_42220 [Epithele typhae]